MYKKLLEQARQKASAATTILEGETPNVEEANKLLAEAKALRERAEAIKTASDLNAGADDAIKAFDKLAAAPPTTQAPLVVVADEEDKLKAVTHMGYGEFMQAVALNPESVRMYKSKDMAGYYDLTAAIGDDRVGSLKQAQHKAISGMSESVPADGGLAVQTDWGGRLMDRVYAQGDILRRVDISPIGANSNGMVYYANAESSRADGSRWGGARYYWLAEGAEKTISHPTLRKVELKLNKIIVYIPATDELLQDTTALESELSEVSGKEITFGVEDSIVSGTGAGQPLGILLSPALITQAAEVAQAAATIVSENIVNMWSRRWAGAKDYIWLIDQSVEPQLHQMNLGVGTGGQLTYMPPGGLSGNPYGTLYGRDIVPVEYCPQLGTVGDIILWSPSSYKMIEKGGMQFASSIHVRFIYDESVFRTVFRTDGQPKPNLPLTPHSGGPTQGPMVVLATRA